MKLKDLINEKVLDDLKKTEDFYHAFKREFNESVRRTCKNYSIKGEKPPVAPSSVCIKEVTDTHNLLDYNLKTIKKDIYKTDNINFIHKGKLKFY